MGVGMGGGGGVRISVTGADLSSVVSQKQPVLIITRLTEPSGTSSGLVSPSSYTAPQCWKRYCLTMEVRLLWKENEAYFPYVPVQFEVRFGYASPETSVVYIVSCRAHCTDIYINIMSRFLCTYSRI